MLITNLFTSLLLFASIYCCSNAPTELQEGAFQLSIIHLNDFHDRFEETSPVSARCRSKDCVGGFSRVYTAINQLLKERPNSLVLNAGDNFQGTIWYSVFKWNVTQHFFNLLPTDAYTLGNHEFDGGIQGIVPFLKALKAPTVVANIDDSEEPDIQGLYNKSIVIERGGKKIGIIGVTTQRAHELSSTGKLHFLNESKSVNEEALRLVSDENVDTIIVLSHCGYEADKVIAQNAAPKIGLIVGGHSHTFLYTGDNFPGPEKPEGPYPTIINRDDRKILIVQASANSKYLGNITVKYNKNGDVISWSGAPIYLNKSVPQDPEINEELQLWKKEVDLQANQLVGYSNVLLKSGKCFLGECNLGNFITDAMIHSYLDTDEENAWTYAAIAITNSGGIRASIPKGNITFNDLALAVPFRNTLDVIEIQGKYLKYVLEYAAGHENNTSDLKINLLPVSGIHIVYNFTKPIGSRIENLKLRCRECLIPVYENLDPEKLYRVVINSFIGGGGDGHTTFVTNAKKIKSGKLDIEALVEYAKRQTPIIQEVEGRIRIIR